MIIEKIQKINRLKNFLDRPNITFIHSFKLSEQDLLHLARAKESIKHNKWLEGAEDLLELVVKNIPKVPIYLLKEFLNILFKLKDYDYELTIKLALYLFEIEQGFDQKLLASLMYEYQKHKEFAEAIRIYQDYFKKYAQQIPNEELELLLAKAYLGLKKAEQAETIILNILDKNHQPNIDENLSEFFIEVYLNLAKIYSVSRRFNEAETLFLKIIDKYPEYDDAQFILANFYFRRDKNKQAENIFKNLIAKKTLNFNYARTYVSYLFQFHTRYEEAMFYAKQFIFQAQNDESLLLEIFGMKLIIAWHQSNFEDGRIIFEELLEVHPNYSMVSAILKQYAEKHQQHEYLLSIMPDLKKSSSAPHFIHMLGETIKKNWWIDSPKLKKDIPLIEEIELPEFIRHLFLELKEEKQSKDEVYLVGGSVIALIKNIELSSQSDVDLIFISNKKEIKNYISSQYIKNLYVRNARQLGGIAVDLVRIDPTEIQQESVLENNACLRDFTICAIFCNEQGKLFDPTGRGIQDMFLKRLDTIFDPQQTLRSDPVRILRAFKYISRGYQPTPDLEYALKNIAMDSFANNQHFNQSLLKALHSIKNIDFVLVMQKYGFLKHLRYLGIEYKGKDVNSICLEMVKSLYSYQLNYSTRSNLEILRDSANLNFSPIQMLENRIDFYQTELESKKITKLKINEQIAQCDFDLQKILVDKEELQKKLESIQKQVVQRKAQQNHLTKKSLVIAEKQQKIAQLKKDLAKKQQSNFDLKQNILALDSEIQEKIQIQYEQLSCDTHQQKMVGFKPCEEMLQSNQSLLTNRGLGLKKLTALKEKSQKNSLEINDLQECASLYQQVSLFLAEDLENFQSTDILPPEETLESNPEKIKYFFESPYPLEQIVRVISIPELKSFLHAHIALSEIKKGAACNSFKICNHLRNFLNFAPAAVKSDFQQGVEHLLNQYTIKTSSKNPQELFQIANDARGLMHCEKAIYYYNEAIRVYSEQSVGTKKVYYDAYFALADLYIQNQDLLQLDAIMSKLKMIRPEPKVVSDKLDEFCQKFQTLFVQFFHITERERSLYGFQDFWVLTLPTLERFAARGYRFSMNFKIRKKIYNDISKKTLFVEEYLLALIEYTNVLMKEQLHDLYKIQLEMIQHIHSASRVIQILKDWALNWSIPASFKTFFFENTMIEEKEPLSLSMAAIQSFSNIKNNTPFHDLEKLLQMQSNTRHQAFHAYLAMYNALKHIENGQDMRALSDLEQAYGHKLFHAYALDYMLDIQKRYPEICWDASSADNWYQLGQSAKLKKDFYFAEYCFHHAMQINEFHLDASLAILHFYEEQKNYPLLRRYLNACENLVNYWSVIHTKNYLTAPQIQKFNSWSLELNRLVLLMEKIYQTQQRMYSESIRQYAHSYQQMSRLFVYFENLDYAKEKFISRLSWTLCSLNISDILNNIKMLTEVVVFNSHKKHDYAFAHFELATYNFKQKNIQAIYHLKEACEIWDGFRLIASELLGLELLCELNEEILKKLNCFYLYQKEMKVLLKAQPTNQELYRNHFRYLIQNRQIQNISEEQLQTYLAIDGITCKQKIEILLLLDNYQEAENLISSEQWLSESDENRLFSWPISIASKQKFIKKAHEFYGKLFCQVDDAELKFNLLRKLIKMSTFLNKFDMLQLQYQMFWSDKRMANTSEYTELVKFYFEWLVQHDKKDDLKSLVDNIYNNFEIFQPELTYWLQKVANPPIGPQMIENFSLFKKMDATDCTQKHLQPGR